jgi:pimeloyl-ACP methyl ester carboxylesterase
MSGGSRIAERMALAYPDKFRGALLHSSADPIGTAEVPLPNPELFLHFQESMRLVYITGQYDAPNIEKDEISRASMRDWCTFDIVTVPFAFAGHELAGESDFEHALTALEGHSPANPRLLSACRDHKAAELAANLEDVQKLMAEGKVPAARSLLEKTDARFGGLAAPKSVELASQMNLLD